MGGTEASRPPEMVERFLKQLVVTARAVVLYPRASSIPVENANEAIKLLAAVLRDRPEMRLTVQKEGLSYNGAVLYQNHPAYEAFARDLYNHGLSEIRFHTGVTAAQLTAFLSIAKEAPADIDSAGGFENRMWELGVDTITVKVASARVVDTEGAGELPEGEEWPPDVDRIDSIMAAALGGRPRDQRLLVRIVADKDLLQHYLRETLSERGADPSEAVHRLKIAELARAIAQADPANRAANYRALSEAIAALDPEIRRRLLTERMLPEARHDEHLASVIRHLDIDEICRWLVEGVSDDQLSTDGLARAIRNLALISLAERETVVNAAGAAMRTAGVGERTVADVLEIVSPSMLQVNDTGAASRPEQAVDSILQLVNLAPGTVSTQYADDTAFSALQEEAARGITDGDVVSALVTLVTVDAHGAEFSAMMALLEDTLELSIERGDFAVAADAAEALALVAGDPDLTANRRERIVKALASLSSKRELAVVTRAMRVFDPETDEHKACGRLLGALGSAAIGPLLEILADEPDMTARKALVDTISGMAERHLDVLGAHLGDSRWYFVRNVVAILGRTKRPELATYLNRTLRHQDSRVRRETVRALSGVQDRMAVEMLIAALDDNDAQNVQLAARYLGVSREASALPALRQVALGEGRGNRETGPRVEAIEALGRLGSRDALPVLEELAGKRALVRASKVRELRTAAEHAIAMLSEAQGGEYRG